MNIEKKCTIAEIIYRNTDNGYTIAVAENDTEQLTIVGTLPTCDKGRMFTLRGNFTNHPKYGEQFAFTEWSEEMPSTEAGIQAFLASGVLKGIGPKAAKSIVDRFGTDTFRIIEEEPGRLTEVGGIGEVKAASIAEAFAAHREVAEVTLYFQQFDIKPETVLKLYRVYGSDTIRLVQENPYRLMEEVYGIGFRKADQIAEKLGVRRDDEARIQSGIRYTLWYHVNEGHTFLPQTELIEKAGELLEVESHRIHDAMVSMALEGILRLEELEGRNVVFLFPYYTAETYVAHGLKNLNEASLKPIYANIEELIDISRRETGIAYSDQQKIAIRTSMENGVTVITGGPGTGKTTIINGIIRILKQSGLTTALAAPTGRAAKRMTETTGHPASTIHRLLEYYYAESEATMRFGKNEENPLDIDALIVDETSMVDLMLMNGLIKAMKPGTRLILVGDADQLPSVGAGNILRDILDSEYIYAVRLKEIFRQAGESLIVVNAHRINRGEYPYCNEKDKDFFLMKESTERGMLATLLDLCKNRLPAHYTHLTPKRDIQVLTPVRKGILGSINLNKEMQALLNPAIVGREEKKFGDKTFREGDKVMQIRNNYSLKWRKASDFTDGEGIFNGDVGFIQRIDTEFNELIVEYDDDRLVTYEFSQLDELELAYAVTVHKSQGSEFPIIVMPVSWFPPILATRNLLYTAVTRGKEAVILVGSEGRMQAMVDNVRISERYSGLKARLGGYLQPAE